VGGSSFPNTQDLTTAMSILVLFVIRTVLNSIYRCQCKVNAKGKHCTTLIEWLGSIPSRLRDSYRIP